MAYVYFEREPGRRAAAHLMTKDEARKISAGIAKLPELLNPERKACWQVKCMVSIIWSCGLTVVLT